MSDGSSAALASPHVGDHNGALAPSTKRRKLDGEENNNASNNSGLPTKEAAELLNTFNSSTELAKPSPAKIGNSSFTPVSGPINGNFVCTFDNFSRFMTPPFAYQMFFGWLSNLF
jgi:hypothetical protein